MSNEQIIGVAENAAGRVQDAVGALAADPSTQVKGKLKQAAGSAKVAYGHIKDVASEAVDHTKENMHVAVDRTREKVREGYGEVETFVQNKPGPALAIAASIGLALGLILRGPSKIVRRREKA
ncbi:MAG: DUF883 family protein [Alphaproteobacteria bacterium]|nr:DUF883 family protein [Alphaproteobacteria bacterium]